MLCFVSWALLAPDPFAVVRTSSLSWVESVSDLLVHTVVFSALSIAWLGLFPLLRRELTALPVFTMLGYCVLMEVFQAFVPGRDCNSMDALCNVAGFVFGLTSLRVLTHLSRPMLSGSRIGEF